MPTTADISLLIESKNYYLYESNKKLVPSKILSSCESFFKATTVYGLTKDYHPDFNIYVSLTEDQFRLIRDEVFKGNAKTVFLLTNKADDVTIGEVLQTDSIHFTFYAFKGDNS